MKKKYLCLLIMFTSSALYCQNNYSKHEFFVSYGISPVHPSEPNLGYNTMTSTPYGIKNTKVAGTFNAGYLFHVSNTFAIGLSYAYESVKRDIVLGSSIPLARIKNNCHIIMPTAKYSWLHLKQLSLYSRISAGLLLMNKGKITDIKEDTEIAQQEDKKEFAWQVIPVGVEWQFIPHLAIYAEGGVGSTGCALTGIKLFF